MIRMLSLVLAFVLVALLAMDAKAQCANGNCSSANATLGESISAVPAPVFAAPQPAPQIAYYTAPGGASASSAASTSAAPSGQFVVAGYTAPPQPAPQMAFFTVPVNQSGGGGSSASASAGSASTAASTSVSPALIGSSTQLACQNGGCGGGGRRFAPFQNLRARRSGNFAKSVSISRG